jgi:hypothetical protein
MKTLYSLGMSIFISGTVLFIIALLFPIGNFPNLGIYFLAGFMLGSGLALIQESKKR